MSSIEEWEEEVKKLRPAKVNEYAKAIETLFQWKMFNENFLHSGLTTIKILLEKIANNEKIDYKNLSTIGFWKGLSLEDEVIFRQWAIDNWYPNTHIDPLWHPVVRGEWRKLDEKYKEVCVKQKVEK